MKIFIISASVFTAASTVYFLSVKDIPAAIFCLVCFLGITKK